MVPAEFPVLQTLFKNKSDDTGQQHRIFTGFDGQVNIGTRRRFRLPRIHRNDFQPCLHSFTQPGGRAERRQAAITGKM